MQELLVTLHEYLTCRQLGAYAGGVARGEVTPPKSKSGGGDQEKRRKK